MAKKKYVNRVYALCFHEDALCVCKLKGEESFHIPVRLDSKPTSHEGKYWANYFLQAVYDLGPFAMRRFEIDGTTYDCYIRSVETPAFGLAQRGEVLFLEAGDPRLKDLDPVSRLLAEHALVYAPLYKRMQRTVPLLEENRVRFFHLVQVVQYFAMKGDIPKQEAREFERLTACASSVSRIEKAYANLIDLYHLDPQEYVRYLRYRNRRRKELV